MKKLMILLCLLVLGSLSLMAHIDMPKPNLSLMPQRGASLFDKTRLSMSHSMGFEAGTSSMGGYYLSRYTNHLMYQLNPKLDMKLDLSVVNFGSTSSSFKINDDNRSRIIPSFSLDYRPTESMSIHIGYRQASPFWGDAKPWYMQDER
ncbi:MAG: hypothetical protein LHW44_02080 [Candidatus Cloacimonetes bacterium]|nr:hypothetical protein [Candidatus Cloacimonadota bacterium]